MSRLNLAYGACHFALVAHVQVFGLTGQFLESGIPFRIDLLFVGSDVAQQYTPVGPDFLTSNLAGIQQLHEVGSGDIQHIGGLMRSEFGVHRHQRHGIAFGHLREQIEYQANRAGRQDNRLMMLVVTELDLQRLLGPGISTTRDWIHVLVRIAARWGADVPYHVGRRPLAALLFVGTLGDRSSDNPKQTQ